jgi:hypothetical protein
VIVLDELLQRFLELWMVQAQLLGRKTFAVLHVVLDVASEQPLEPGLVSHGISIFALFSDSD